MRQALETNLDQAPGTGGPDHHTFWLSTIDADGRPHMTAVGAFWVDGRYYFCGGPRSRKIRNIERDPRCAFGVAIHGYDVALEGRAARVTDEAMLQRLAEVFAEGGWAPTVADGGFTHDYSAPSAGPPPWYVYEFTARRRLRGRHQGARRRHPMDLLTLGQHCHQHGSSWSSPSWRPRRTAVSGLRQTDSASCRLGTNPSRTRCDLPPFQALAARRTLAG